MFPRVLRVRVDPFDNGYIVLQDTNGQSVYYFKFGIRFLLGLVGCSFWWNFNTLWVTLTNGQDYRIGKRKGNELTLVPELSSERRPLFRI